MRYIIIALLLILTVRFADAQLIKSHSNERFTIDYPENWNIDQSGMMGMTFILLSEQENAEDLFRENVNLIEQDLTGYNMNLDQYVDINLSQLKTIITNFDLKTSIRKSESPEYHKVIYNGSQGQYNLTIEQYIWVVGMKAYILTFTAEQAQFEKYQKKGESILNSFKIK